MINPAPVSLDSSSDATSGSAAELRMESAGSLPASEQLKLVEEEVEVIEDEDEDLIPVHPDLDKVRNRHRFVLSMSLLVVVLAPLLVVMSGQDRIAFRWWPGFALPETCYTKYLIPAGCPGCGLTRSTIYLFQGRLHDAWDMHRLGPLTVLVILLQIPYRLFAMYGPSPAPLGERLPKWLGYGLIALFLGNWVWKIIETGW